MAMKRKLDDHQRATLRGMYATGAYSKSALARLFGLSVPGVDYVLDPARRAAVRSVRDKAQRARRRAAGLPTPMQEYRAANLEACKAAWREWYVRNREQVRANHQAWRKANPEAVRAANLRRRAGGRLSAATIKYVLKLSGGRCAYCREPDTYLEIDHVVPVAAGGGHELSNLAAACRHCNASKGTMSAEDFIKRLRTQVKQESIP